MTVVFTRYFFGKRIWEEILRSSPKLVCLNTYHLSELPVLSNFETEIIRHLTPNDEVDVMESISSSANQADVLTAPLPFQDVECFFKF